MSETIEWIRAGTRLYAGLPEEIMCNSCNEVSRHLLSLEKELTTTEVFSLTDLPSPTTGKIILSKGVYDFVESVYCNCVFVSENGTPIFQETLEKTVKSMSEQWKKQPQAIHSMEKEN